MQTRRGDRKVVETHNLDIGETDENEVLDYHWYQSSLKRESREVLKQVAQQESRLTQLATNTSSSHYQDGSFSN